MVFTAIALAGLASMFAWVASNAKVTKRNNEFVASQYAAEAAVENVLSQVSQDYSSPGLSNAAFYAGIIPTNFTASWPVQYQFSNPVSNTVNQVYVFLGATATNTAPLPPPYTGLQALSRVCQIRATATPLNQLYNVPATVTETFQVSSIPIFQFLIFYNIDCEIDAGQVLTAQGPVFSNAGLWTGTPNDIFDSTVWAVGKVVNGANDPFATYTGTGQGVFNKAGQPVSGVAPLHIPVAGANTNTTPAVVETLLQWPPTTYEWGTAAGYSSNGITYFANAADLVISNGAAGINGATGTNTTIYFQDQALLPFGNARQKLVNDYYVVTNAVAHVWWSTNYIGPNVLGPGTNVLYAGFTFVTNVVYYDWREYWNAGNGNGGHGKTVQALQIDVSRFNAWLDNTNLDGTTNLNGGKYYRQLKGNSLGGIYAYNSVAPTPTSLPAVRVVNGQQLYDRLGFAVATPFPFYIKGDFNVSDGTGSNAGQNSTSHARPAAFYADSITVLSSDWDDGFQGKLPKATTTTTINAACMGGIVPSDPTLGTPSDSSQYSGGVENFFRLLQSWRSNAGAQTPFYYNGSIVVMFPSQYATNRWRKTGNYYDPPDRHWMFDTNFAVQDRLPPMAPQIKTVVKNNWAAK